MSSREPAGAPNPRTLLVALLQAFDCDVPVQLLIRAASVFEIDENRTRVALHRLRSKGLVASVERGTYRVTGHREVHDATMAWRRVLDRLRTWNGGWIGVHTAPLPRADKTVARHRDRATRFVGLRELQPGLLLRPDNLQGGVEALRKRLEALGLEPEAPVFRITDLGAHDAKARALWKSLHLDRRYRRHVDRLERLSDQVGAMSAEQAAREAFVAGGEAVRDIVLDPLLPAPLVDPALRERFVRTMTAFDEVGRRLWAEVLETDLHLRTAPTAEPR